MSNYTKATNFAVKDGLTTGDPDKKVKGTEIDNEFNAIASAISSKADANSPTLTGTPLAPTASSGTNTTQIATTAFVTSAVSAAAGVAAITSGTINGAVIGGTTAAAITGTTITATTDFVGDLTGNVTGNVTGTVSGNAGTVTNGVYTTNFTGTNQSLSSTGYQKLPGGLIIQWGSFTPSAGRQNTTVTFPVAFASACCSVTASPITTSAVQYASAINNVSTTSCKITNDSSGVSIYWMAIGY